MKKNEDYVAETICVINSEQQVKVSKILKELDIPTRKKQNIQILKWTAKITYNEKERSRK